MAPVLHQGFTAFGIQNEVVQPGAMMETEERRTLQEIDDAKRIRKVSESFQADSDATDAEYAAIENFKKGLDDHEVKAISERYHALEAEMNVIQREVDLSGDPSPLFEQQRKLQRQINTLFSERYDLISRLREDDTQYYPTASGKGADVDSLSLLPAWRAPPMSSPGESSGSTTSTTTVLPHHHTGELTSMVDDNDEGGTMITVMSLAATTNPIMVANQITYPQGASVWGGGSMGKLRFHLSSMFPVVEKAT